MSRRTAPARWARAFGLGLSLSLLACPHSESLRLEPPPADLPRVQHVILLVVDGLRTDEIDAQNTPTLFRLVQEGASTLEARTVTPHLTLPAFCSMLSGLTPHQHGIYWDTYDPSRGFLRATTIFDLAREAGLSTAVFAGKKKLRHLMRPDRVDRFSVSNRTDRSVMQEAIAYLWKANPNLMLIHLPQVDVVGHLSGWASPAQLRAAHGADTQAAALLDSIDKLDLRDSTVVLFTADHGGSGYHHLGNSPQETHVPWVLWGGTIEPRRIEPVSITATAATVLRLLGIEVPRDWLEREPPRKPASGAAS